MIDYLAYSMMLTQQTEMCFPFEYGFYKNVGIEGMRNITEIGCGNGHFLNTLSKYFCNSNYYGYDHCHELIEQAVSDSDRVIFKLGSIEALNDQFDALILRLVIHQIEDRKKFIAKICEKVIPNSKIIMIDAFDEKFQLTPVLPAFTQHLTKHRNILSPNTASRRVKDCVIEEMQAVGFDLTQQEYYYVSSLLPGYKEKYRDYMLSTSNIVGCTQDVVKEIENWHQDPAAYAQIGLFMYCFEKKRV